MPTKISHVQFTSICSWKKYNIAFIDLSSPRNRPWGKDWSMGCLFRRWFEEILVGKWGNKAGKERQLEKEALSNQFSWWAAATQWGNSWRQCGGHFGVIPTLGEAAGVLIYQLSIHHWWRAVLGSFILQHFQYALWGKRILPLPGTKAHRQSF